MTSNSIISPVIFAASKSVSVGAWLVAVAVSLHYLELLRFAPDSVGFSRSFFVGEE